MTDKLMQLLVKGIAPVLRDYVQQELEKLRVELGTRITELEARPTPEHVGKWQEGTLYKAQQMTQHDGSCWFALRMTDSKPGTSDAWRLVAKGGRDAR